MSSPCFAVSPETSFCGCPLFAEVSEVSDFSGCAPSSCWFCDASLWFPESSAAGCVRSIGLRSASSGMCQTCAALSRWRGSWLTSPLWVSIQMMLPLWLTALKAWPPPPGQSTWTMAAEPGPACWRTEAILLAVSGSLPGLVAGVCGARPADLVGVRVVLGGPGVGVAVCVRVEGAGRRHLGVAVPGLQEGAGAVGAVVAAAGDFVAAVVLELRPWAEGVGEPFRGAVLVARDRVGQRLLVAGVGL